MEREFGQVWLMPGPPVKVPGENRMEAPVGGKVLGVRTGMLNHLKTPGCTHLCTRSPPLSRS